MPGEGKAKFLVLGLFLLTLMFLPNPPLLLTFKLVIKQEEGLLICLWSTNDGEHALACLVVWCLGNGDPGAGEAPDLRNFGATTADDTTNHIGRYGNILGA